MSYEVPSRLPHRLLLLCFFLLVGLSLFVAKPASAAATPPGFADSLVANVGAPTGLAVMPDKRLLVTTQPGKLQVIDKNGEMLARPALDLAGKVCTNSERGLLGVAVDPDFASNNYIYLYYTAYQSGGCVNRVSRFVMPGDTADPASETKLLDNIYSTNGNHNGGDVHFGKDGYLYVSVGDGGCSFANRNACQYQNNAARYPNVLLGKILRVTRDGEIPPDNPYVGTNSARCNVAGSTQAGKFCQETFASGLRNPFRMAFDPDAAGTSFRINEVGGAAWEEIDEGKAGADYGWNLCEGYHDNPYQGGQVNCGAAPLTPPIHEYNHNTGCTSITGGAFVPDGVWPTEYDKDYLFGDYTCGGIFRLTPKDGGGYTRTGFATVGGGGPIATTFGPTYDGNQALYYATYAGGGQVRRIEHTDTPTAVVTANSTSEEKPLLAYELDGSESRDPNGDTLTYLWGFGDENTDETTDPKTSHTYSDPGEYTITLRVRDSTGATSAPATVRVDTENYAPEPEITAPTTSEPFRVGEEITLSGQAADTEDEAANTAPTLSWEVVRHHNDSHTHPWFSGSGNDQTFEAPAPEDLLSTDPDGNYLEIKLTATDSEGLSRTVSQKLLPKTVDVSFATYPAGLQLSVNGTEIYSARTLTSWEGYELNVYTPPRQKIRRHSQTYAFVYWSDGGAYTHTITTPSEPTAYTAAFRRLRR